MTVTASPVDVPPGTATGTPQGTLGKGGTLLAAITNLNTAIANTTQPQAVANLNAALVAAQVAAVDYFMQSFWVSADQIIAQMATAPTDLRVISRKELSDANSFVNRQLALIAQRQAQVTAAIAAGTPTVNPLQYSVAYPPPMAGYPLTLPDAVLYQLQTQLVDYYMAKAILPASLILSTMTGVQTYPWNGYESNYTEYQQWLEYGPSPY